MRTLIALPAKSWQTQHRRCDLTKVVSLTALGKGILDPLRYSHKVHPERTFVIGGWGEPSEPQQTLAAMYREAHGCARAAPPQPTLLRRSELMGMVSDGRFRVKQGRTTCVHWIGAAHPGGAVGYATFAFSSGNTAYFRWHRTCLNDGNQRGSCHAFWAREEESDLHSGETGGEVGIYHLWVLLDGLHD